MLSVTLVPDPPRAGDGIVVCVTVPPGTPLPATVSVQVDGGRRVSVPLLAETGERSACVSFEIPPTAWGIEVSASSGECVGYWAGQVI